MEIFNEGVVTTIAGVLTLSGTQNGAATQARFYCPLSIAVASSGDLYILDHGNHSVRKLTKAGVVSLFAGIPTETGSIDGTGTAARFNRPFGIAIDPSDNLFVSDHDNQTIRKITPAGVVTTVAGSPGSSGYMDATGADARFAGPDGMVVAPDGNLYVADTYNNAIRKVTTNGEVYTFVGGVAGSSDGTGTLARLNRPAGVTSDSAGNFYVAELGNHTIRKVSPGGVVTLYAGQFGAIGQVDAQGTQARFNQPSDVAVDAFGNVYVADYFNHAIRKINSARNVTTLAGALGTSGSLDGTGNAARLWYPRGLEVDDYGNLYVADQYNQAIRLVR
jgi:streptogramin lyase